MDLDKIQEHRDQEAQNASVEKQDSQHAELLSSINNLIVATMATRGAKMIEVTKELSHLISKLAKFSDSLDGSSVHKLSLTNDDLADSISKLVASLDNQDSTAELKPYFETFVRQLNMIAGKDVVVNVPEQSVEVDLKPIVAALKDVQKEISKNKIDIPKSDTEGVIDGLKAVQKTISNLSFPVPNYVLPFKGSNGEATQVQLDANGKVPISGTISVDTTGLATEAKQNTIIGHLDGVEGTLTTIDGDTGNISTKIDTLAGAVAGSEMQVDVVAPLPAGTNVLGHVITDSDSVSTVSSAHVIGNAVPANSFYIAGRNSAGNLAGANLAYNAINSSGNQFLGASILAQFDDVSPTAITENQFGNVRMSGNRNLYNTIRDAAGNERGVNVTAGNALTVDGSATTQPVSNAGLTSLNGAISGTEVQVDVVGALPAGTNNIGDVDVASAVSGTMDHGSNRDVDTSAEQITSTSFACKFGLTLRASESNTGIIYIGNSDVTAGTTDATDGMPLSPGDSLFLPVTNSNIPYAIASANNQIIYWVAV